MLSVKTEIHISLHVFVSNELQLAAFNLKQIETDMVYIFTYM